MFVVFAATTSVVEQREIPKTSLAGAKPFEKINARPSSGSTLCVHLRPALRKPLYREKGEVLSIITPCHAGPRSLQSFTQAAFFCWGGLAAGKHTFWCECPRFLCGRL